VKVPTSRILEEGIFIDIAAGNIPAAIYPRIIVVVAGRGVETSRNSDIAACRGGVVPDNVIEDINGTVIGSEINPATKARGVSRNGVVREDRARERSGRGLDSTALLKRFVPRNNVVGEDNIP
jgi:hypothetical protein